MTDLLDALDALAEKATARPWTYTTCYGVATIEQRGNRDACVAHAVEYLEREDADFIVELANAYPQLAARLRAAETLAEKYAFHSSSCNWDGNQCACGYDESNETWRRTTQEPAQVASGCGTEGRGDVLL